MPARTLKVPPGLREAVRRLHPELKRKVRAALADILEDPACGKPLEKELKGYWRLGLGRHRIIYRPVGDVVEIVAIGPRRTIYEETARQILRGREKS
jgi:mRNA interferase RelE/StbE